MKLNHVKWQKIQADLDVLAVKIEKQEIEHHHLEGELNRFETLLHTNFGDFYHKLIRDKSIGLEELEKNLHMIESKPNQYSDNLAAYPKIINVLKDVYKIAICVEKQRLILVEDQKAYNLQAASIEKLQNFVQQNEIKTNMGNV